MNRLVLIIDYAKEQLKDEKTGHDFHHAQQTALLATKILKEDHLKANEFIIQSSAYLHDVIDDKVAVDVDQALEQLKKFLQQSAASKNEISQILFIIQHLSFSAEMFGEKKELPLEGKIVQDADRLEALGAGGILRAAYFSGAHGEKIYDKKQPPIKAENKAQYRQPTTTINHFYEKLFLLPDMMNTDYGKKEGQRRKEFMTDFLKEFFSEQV